MADRDEILTAITQGQENWKHYLKSLSPNVLRKVDVQLKRIVDDHAQFLEDMECASAILEREIKSRGETSEKKRRGARVKKRKISLRTYLSEPFLETDNALRSLSLCTKTGAAVLLEGLSYTVEGNSLKVDTVNEAKRYWQGGHEPWAGYHLHYVRDGRISARFGWDRPFLDEIFVLSSAPGMPQSH